MTNARKAKKSYPKRKTKRKSSNKYPSAIGGVLKKSQNASFLYQSMTHLSAAALADISAQLKLNSMNDLDAGSNFLNKQPLGFDTLCTSNMYNAYEVKSWSTTITLINTNPAPVTVYYTQANTTTIADSITEMQNWPGAKILFLGGSDGGNNKVTFTVKGTTNKVLPGYRDRDNMAAAYNSDPNALCYGTLRIHDSNLAALAVDCKLKHIFNAKLTDMRTVVS